MNKLLNWDHGIHKTSVDSIVSSLVTELSTIGIRPVAEGTVLNFYVVQGLVDGEWIHNGCKVISVYEFGESLFFGQYSWTNYSMGDRKQAKVNGLEELFHSAMTA